MRFFCRPNLVAQALSLAFVLLGWPQIGSGAEAAPVTITIHADRRGPKINEAMWGIFFEDINLGADGGLYAELVKNRSFEFPEPLMGWKKISDQPDGQLEVHDQEPFNGANRHYLHLESAGVPFGVANEGFRAMGFRAGETYSLSLQVRPTAGTAVLRLELADPKGRALATARITDLNAGWQKRSVALTPGETEAHGRLQIFVEDKGGVDLDMVSLFPAHTWKDRAGGLRADMVQMLADMKPGFLRFPGGCIVEGSELDRRYQWKTTIGPVEERKLLINRWNYIFRHRPAPDYFQSFGLGFFEFFQLCDDLGAAPLPILNCGMACQFNSGQLVPLEQLDPFIQDALDLIEFANGDRSTVWGGKRAALGHAEPFKLRMLGIGNEQWGPQYVERYARFAKALKQKHPEILLVSSAGPSPADDRFQFLWPKLREMKADIVDEHCYANPIWFLSSSHRYDGYDRAGPKVFMGEYAAQNVAIASPKNENTLECALAEAAFMTGLERNADVVQLASYAPLFAHVDGWQWTPNLIWADNLRVFGTPSYYVQQLFSRHRGDRVLPLEMSGGSASSLASGRIGLGVYQTAAEFKDLRVQRAGETVAQPDFAGENPGWQIEGGQWSAKAGVFQQTDPKSTGRALFGDATWSDYTLTLRGRKVAGNEGFIIIVRDLPGSRVQWNLGGWGNQQHGIQALLGAQEQIVAQTPGSIETGRWYEIKIALKGPDLECYLDGKLVQKARVPPPQVQPLYATAARDERAGELILKVSNPGAATRAAIELAGVTGVAPRAKAFVLQGEKPTDVNSLDQPRKLAPVETEWAVPGPRFERAFPAHSFSVLRIKTR
jgi:alpha-L-arabinofuranosidase